MKKPRGLSDDEAAAWDAVTRTVEAFSRESSQGSLSGAVSSRSPSRPPTGLSLSGGREGARDGTAPERQRGNNNATLDGHRDRRLKSGRTDPDFSLDLHGHTLDAAWHRLDSGLAQAKAMGARVVLVVTGKPRPVDAADRGTSRGAIRAKILDWLAAGPHANDIAAIRRAHRRHGGEGALYLVLRRR
ncbi:MAG: Smr/MutS family protein [Parerythrobacter sp.]